MTVGEAYFKLLSVHIVSLVSFVGETLAILSTIFIMICFFGIEGKITKKTYLTAWLYSVLGLVINLYGTIVEYSRCKPYWNETVDETFVDVPVNQVLQIIIFIASFLTLLATAIVTFKKHRIINGIISFIIWIASELYFELGIAVSAVYFAKIPEEAAEDMSALAKRMGNMSSSAFFISYFVVFCTLFLLLYFGMIKKQRTMYIGWKYRILFIIWEVIMVIVPQLPISKVNSYEEHIRYMGYLIGFIVPVMGFAMPMLIISIVTRRYAYEKTLIQENYISAELDYIKQYKKDQEETRAFRHDIVNNLSVVSTMFKKKDYSDATEYLKSLLGEVRDMSPKYITGDEMLDCIVGMKASKMDEEGIGFSVDGVIDGGLGMKPVDVCSIFANAMDNAIEACERLSDESDKWIRLSMKRTDKFFSIKLSNSMPDNDKSFDVTRLFGDGERVTSKKDRNLHGYGTQNMKAAISRYDGIEKVDAEDGIFTLSIMIPRTA